MGEIYKLKTSDQVYESMKRYLIGENSKLNNFNIGSRLSVLLEAVANIVADNNMDYYNGLKKAIPTSLYNAFGFSKKAGTNASGSMTFYRNVAATEVYTIPIGTVVILNGIKFETTTTGSIGIGNTDSGSVASQCSIVGEDGNISAGSIDTLVGQGSFVSTPVGVDYCENTVAFTGGTSEESDSDRIERFNTYINSLARCTVSGLIAGTLSVEGIIAVSVLENYPTEGWCTIYADDGTGTLTPAKKAEIEKVINGDPADYTNYPGYRAAGIQVQVLMPDVQTINFSIDIKILDTSLADSNELKDAAQNALETYVNTLRIGMDVILSEITKNIKNSSSSIYDVEYITPTSNVTIATTKIAKTGAVSVTYSYVSI